MKYIMKNVTNDRIGKWILKIFNRLVSKKIQELLQITRK